MPTHFLSITLETKTEQNKLLYRRLEVTQDFAGLS